MKALRILPFLLPVGPLPAIPLPEARVVTTDYHGVKVDDPYRYFGDKDNPEVAAWARALTEKSLAALSQVPERGKIMKIIENADAVQGDRVGWVAQPRPGEYFFLMRRQGEQVEQLFHQKPGGKPELVLDPRKIVDGKGSPVTIKHFSISPDVEHLAVAVTSGGGEDADLYVISLADGKVTEGPFSRARWGPAEWLPDSSGFFQTRLQDLAPGADPLQKFQKSRVYLHRLGTPEKDDRAVFGFGTEDGTGVKPADIVSLSPMGTSGWVLSSNGTGVSSDDIHHIARLDEVIAGTARWRKICDRSHLVGSMGGGAVELHGDHLYILSRKDAPNGRVLRISIDELDFAKAETVYTSPRGSIQGIKVAREGLYVRYLDGGPSRLVRLRWDAPDKPEAITMPGDGRISLHGNIGAYPDLEGIGVSFSSWTGPTKLLRVPADGTVAETLDLPQQAEPAISKELISRETTMPGHDGVEIPVSIIHRKDLPQDGRRPVLLGAYGAYGISIEPGFRPSDAAIYDMGGIRVVAHVRGGGELGDEWRLAGFQKTKPNTWKDVISVAEGLVREGYTTPAHICIQGASAGGITVGRAMTEKPDAVGAVLCGVGCMDAIRMENSPNGIPNLAEFGSVKTKEGFGALLEMSAYAHVKPGVKYPPILFYHGANDTRVELWQSLKMTARLISAQGPDAPVLLRVDYHLGHGSGSSRKQENEQQADLLAFFFSRCK
jgi:prolyl oligopeptidase